MRSRSDRIHVSESAREAPGAPPASAHADEEPPEGELAEVRIIAANPDIAQRVAQLLREAFDCDEPRSYPAGVDGRGTLLHLTVDTAHPSATQPSASPWLTTSRSQAQRAHTDEPG
jgi:hypothetical protein